MELLSVIVPCYNEEENVFPFYEELMKNGDFFKKRGLEAEIIFVNDGSKDDTAAKVKELQRSKNCTKKTKESSLFRFQEISARSLRSMPDLRNPKGTMWS